MPTPCFKCAETRILNLDTVQRIGTTGSCLIGGAIGAWRSVTVTGPLLIATARFPLAKLPVAMMGALAGGQTGARVAALFFSQWLPPGEGTPWLCLSCGHIFRQPLPPLASAR
ncbi:hypothetical protein [Halomonas sp. hl-4]|uniref:hypothetical protein n=1 Tax=Halomonas sp. hl-4 TaxID=1761789 RepID=UPI000BB746D9|nr:hypothetical protein [Halomonas sp. hl-4]SNY97912.1 hypothetical protein SAMN04488142_2521 [Halomonas sp. hl-4]